MGLRCQGRHCANSQRSAVQAERNPQLRTRAGRPSPSGVRRTAALSIGAVLSLAQIGGLLGAIVGNRITRAIGIGRTIIATAALIGPSSYLVASAPRSHPIPLLILGLAIGSFTGVIFNVAGTSLRQAIVPAQLQGRVVGFNRTIVWGVIPIGSLTGGALAAGIGLRAAIITGATVCLFAVIPLLFSPVRTLRELPTL